MKHLTRLRRLEAVVPPPAPKPVGPRTEADWIELMKGYARDGAFNAEVDFPRAIAEYEDALARALAQANPPYEPPASFAPDVPYWQRIDRWRTKDRFPALNSAFDWLMELLGRYLEGVPPVSEAEFASLAAWFHAHDDRLRAIERGLPAQLLERFPL